MKKSLFYSVSTYFTVFALCLHSLGLQAAELNTSNWKVVRSGSLTEYKAEFAGLKVRQLQNPENEKEEVIEVDFCNVEKECKLAHRISKSDFDKMVKKGTMSLGWMAVAGVIGIFTWGIGTAAMAGGEKLVNGPYYRVAELEQALGEGANRLSGQSMSDFQKELSLGINRFSGVESENAPEAVSAAVISSHDIAPKQAVSVVETKSAYPESNNSAE